MSKINKTSAEERALQAALQRKYAEEKPANAAPSITYGNSNSGAPYRGNAMQCVRPGAGVIFENGRGV